MEPTRSETSNQITLSGLTELPSKKRALEKGKAVVVEASQNDNLHKNLNFYESTSIPFGIGEITPSILEKTLLNQSPKSTESKSKHPKFANCPSFFPHLQKGEIGESSNNPQSLSSPPQTLSPSVAEKGRVCKTCGRIFSTFQALGGHQNAHKKEREIQRAMAAAQNNPVAYHMPSKRMTTLSHESHYRHQSQCTPYQGYASGGMQTTHVYPNSRMILNQSSSILTQGLVQVQPTLAQGYVQCQPRVVQDLVQGKFGLSQGLVHNQPNLTQGFVYGQPNYIKGLIYGQLSHVQGLIHGQPNHSQSLVLGIPSHAQGHVHNQPNLPQAFFPIQLSHAHNLVQRQPNYVQGLGPMYPSNPRGLVHEQPNYPQGLIYGQPNNPQGLVHRQSNHPQGLIHMQPSHGHETLHSHPNISHGLEGFNGNSSMNPSSLTYDVGWPTPYIGPSGLIRASDLTNFNCFATSNLANYTHVRENEGNLAKRQRMGSTSFNSSLNGSQPTQANILVSPNESTMLDLNLKL